MKPFDFASAHKCAVSNAVRNASPTGTVPVAPPAGLGSGGKELVSTVSSSATGVLSAAAGVTPTGFLSAGVLSAGVLSAWSRVASTTAMIITPMSNMTTTPIKIDFHHTGRGVLDELLFGDMLVWVSGGVCL